jgi:predicted SAM-dependent methyltransferase
LELGAALLPEFRYRGACAMKDMLALLRRTPLWQVRRFQQHLKTAFRAAREQLALAESRDYLRNTRLAVITQYLKAHSPKKLQIGCGKIVTDGWLCTDLHPTDGRVIFLDCREAFPFSDHAFDYIHSEHLIEHLSYNEGMFMLRESFRVLRPGGRIRIATPNLVAFAHLCVDEISSEQQAYLDWATANFLPGHSVARPSLVVNNMFRDWGHQFLYDEATLGAVLSEVGFTEIVRCAVGESVDPHLRGVEMHGSLIGESQNLFETLAMEAVRPL